MKPKLGLVGLGNIGEPMCRHLLNRGYKVAVYDVNPEAVSRLGDTPAEPVENLETLAVGTDVVLDRPGARVRGRGPYGDLRLPGGPARGTRV